MFIHNAQNIQNTTMISSDSENKFSNMLIFSNANDYYIEIKAMNLELSIYLSTNNAGINSNLSNHTNLYNNYQSIIDDGIVSIIINNISNATSYISNSSKYIQELTNLISNLQTALNNLQIGNDGFLPSNSIITSCQSNIEIAYSLSTNIETRKTIQHLQNHTLKMRNAYYDNIIEYTNL